MTIDLLIGNSAGDTFDTLMDSKNSLKSPSNIAISIPGETILQRPDIQEALFALQEETAKVGVAEAQRYPSFSFTGSLGLEALTINALGSSSANFSSIQANLLAPIFNSGGLTANLNAQVATRDAALESYKNVISNGLMETEQALVKLLSIKDQLSDISRSVEAGGKHLELTQYKYQSGLVSHRDVLDSLNELNSLKTKQSQIQFSELTSITQLYKTLGGGWAQTVKN
jgi:outer membrane protein TolC